MQIELIKKNKVNALYLPTFEEIAKYIHENMQEDDIILTIGAGNITHLNDIL